MPVPAFSIARLPKIVFGSNTLSQLPDLAADYGNRILLVTGQQAFEKSSQWQFVKGWLDTFSPEWQHARVTQEPSPELVDALVKQFAGENVELVIGIGGGSVLDAAKAVAGLLRVNHSVMDFLEGVGPELLYPGPAVPYIAVPTTAGTGSEATKNAVLSTQGKNGFKKSFRDEQLVPDIALVDPILLESCPDDLIAANGMDALTQLMESFVSTKANIMTDALAVSGLRACRDGLLDWYHKTGDQPQARECMAYASMISGINLAQTGLGSVHGLASPLGAFYPIPHGVVCGTLVATATRINIETMKEREPENPSLQKYARLATILCNRKFKDSDNAYRALIELLNDWTEQMKLPRLSTYNIQEPDLDYIVKHSRGSSMKTNPIVLTDDEVKAILLDRL